MLEQLKDVPGILGVNPERDKFYEHFLESVANGARIAQALVTAWELTSYECFKHLPLSVTIVVGKTLTG